MKRFYVYDFGDIPVKFRWDYDRFFYERWCREALAALHDHPARTNQPQQADFFVVAASLRFLSFCGVDHPAAMADLDFLDNGPHVIFDLTDHPQPLFSGDGLMVCKSAFHRDHYQPHAHIPIPQFPRYRFNRPFTPASRRPRLAGFKGNLRPECGPLRQRLAVQASPSMLIETGVFTPQHLNFTADGNVEEVERPGEHSHTNILFDSTFALLPRANGYALSYRMIESMEAGCIPVIISDGYVLPFEDVLDYNSFAVRLPESQIENLEEHLRRRLPQADGMQAAAHAAYRQYFATTRAIIHTTLDLISRRLSSGEP